ncbi:hypothetical protein EMIHUDRAFT_108214 [Emiliania huxleyi CCMP1516]|uniref:Uncharacterized protein n=2 Tax=Emiliania huxleyi TaxID=2903 RepID=A0A0D3KZ45_EMIH1|nr:hypothetical protein EMIHUDRAFT_108214 [Emiliania huxleyi CCMP1516]EOD41030.1 hypothetical protein EMIHUDRAFT_108214 [Emiliania huxleyi CCMP1516]|eukprot:XP_005793459.1 hypothetical protein EMIHUDRAFT_108214 [Emiliania huxleyi CCMP1516]
MRLLLLGLLAGLAVAESGPTLIPGDALGSDSAMHASIDHDWKTCSAFHGCRGGDRSEKMVSVELAGAGAAGSSAHHAPNASASLAGAEAHKCTMNECPCATSESGDANVCCKDNKLSEFSIEGDSARATPGRPSLREGWWCCASAAVLLLEACGACWLLLGQRAPRSGAASRQRSSKAVRPRLSKKGRGRGSHRRPKPRGPQVRKCKSPSGSGGTGTSAGAAAGAGIRCTGIRAGLKQATGRVQSSFAGAPCATMCIWSCFIRTGLCASVAGPAASRAVLPRLSKSRSSVLFGFYQICTVLSSTYSARLPPEYTGWTDKLANTVSIDWSGLFLPQQCLGYDLRLLAIALSPVAFIALLMAAGISLRLYRWRAAPPPRPMEATPGADTDAAFGLVEASMSVMSAIADAINADEDAPRAAPWYAEAALGVLDLTPAGLVLIFCFVPSISASIFRAWSCKAYTISPPDSPLEQVSYMRLDASVECYTEDHESIADLAIGLIALWPAGSLILFTSLLVACYKPLQAKRPNALTRATGFLHREYKKKCYWWEVVELARKLVLTGFVLLIPEKSAFLRLVVATLVCSFYAVVLAVVRPFKRVEDNVLAVARLGLQATSLVLLLLFLAANWTTIFLGIIERSSVDTADAVLGFDNLSEIINSMLVLVGVTLLFFLIGAVFSARHAKEVPTIRLVSTNQPPELSVGMGITWHLFNSHIWSTGQDAVAVIKKQLQILLPGIKIFLDARACCPVDDLKDIGALEEYIQRSQNCLREVRSSLEMDKPLVLVQEADPAKGGGTLPALRAECPEELQPDIFDKDWPLTIWYRIKEFQIALLLCSPNFLDSTSLPLTVTGELRIRAFGFSTFAKVWASPANAGAKELADELVAAFPGLTVSTAEEAGDATHMLLYLNEHSFSDERLAEQVTQARQDRLPIVMAHENDPDRGGCEFAKFFETTPQELIAGGLYKDLARSCFPGRHREARARPLAAWWALTGRHAALLNPPPA